MIHVDSKNVLRYLKNVPVTLNKEIRNSVKESSQLLTNYVKRKYLSGTGVGVDARSGELRKSTKPARTVITKDGVLGGVRIGDSTKAKKYRDIHIGPPTQVTTIRSKRSGGYLAIPVGPALRANGTSRYKSPREVSGLTIKGKKGSQTILARKNGETYFIYKKRVQVHARIDPNHISKNYAPIVSRNINKAVEDSL